MDEKQLKRESRELRNVSKHNKNKVWGKRISMSLDDKTYDIRISKISNKSVKLEIEVDYETIVSQKNDPLEKRLWDILTDVYADTKSTTIGERRVFI